MPSGRNEWIVRYLVIANTKGFMMYRRFWFAIVIAPEMFVVSTDATRAGSIALKVWGE